ncbi:Cell division protein FtsK [Hyalangium minutum]|uniref:Cell division protein FtsK n=2 Tax=Hyalangium minutum TaxID=394096 RepID=A0A085WXE6_9BACT|nr:Cell division protein FtsK [Hyalangium minutum]
MRARATEDAQAQASAGTAEVVRSLEARRGIARAVALKLAASAELATAAQELSAQEALTAESFAPVRTAAEAVLPKELPGVVIGLVTHAGAVHARAGSEPSTDAAAFDVKVLAQADAPTVVDAFGAPHAVASVPLLWRFVRIPGAEKLETQLAATLVVAVPLLSEGALEDAAKASGAAALGLVKENALVAGGGEQKSDLEKALGSLKTGQPAAAIVTGQLQNLGPVKLPILTSGKDFMGGQAPLVVGTRRALEGTPYEVIALAHTKLMGTLADYQRNAIMGLGALLAVSLVWTVLMGSGKRASGAPAESSGDTLGLSNAMAAMPSQQAPAAQPAAEPPPVTHPGLELTAAAPVAEPARPPTGEFPFGPPPSAPDAPASMAPPPVSEPFAFPPPPAAQPQPFDDPFGAPLPGGVSMPFESAQNQPPPAAAPQVATATARAGAFHFEELPTAAYSLQQAADPYAAAVAMDSPETTRVAAIPRELLQAAARPSTQEMPAYAPPPSPAAPAMAPVPWGDPAPQAQAIPPPGANYQQFLGNTGDAFSEEEFHFQEVFREFVITREKCSEPSDGLTYDKFVQKLRKNKDQLVQKYACRTVKFQVYVKEGKAALKATPVKD